MKLIKHIKNERGMTLVIVMVLSVVALIIMSALIYMVQSGTEISGMQKRYTTALDAGMGGVGLQKELIDTMGSPNFQGITTNIPNQACVTAKLANATGAGWAGCSNSVTLDPLNAATYDMRATLGSYTVYTKIVDTIPGNTAQGTGLSDPTASRSGHISVQAMPYIYTLQVLSLGTGTNERSKLSAVYEY